MIDDLNTGCMIHKYTDDTTLSEFINKGNPVARTLTSFNSWIGLSNNMNVNVSVSSS